MVTENTNTTDGAFNYNFPAIRGIQAGKEYYVTMCPMRLIPRIFTFDEEEIPAEIRAQRVLNKARVPEIAKYITENPKDYAFSAITASIDGRVDFKPFSKDAKIGDLTIPMNSKFLINDGQHRRAAIEQALKNYPDLGNETISVVFFIDTGLKRSQQLFSDLNKHAIRPTRSLSILYDHRDPLSSLMKSMIERIDIFKGRVEIEKTTISNRSLKLFTLSNLYQATKALLGKTSKYPKISENETKTATEFWTEVSANIPEWNMVLEKNVSPAELRSDYIHAHGIALQAIGTAGYALLGRYPEEWKKRLKGLRKINWLRSNSSIWEGRATIGGRISKSQINVTLTTNYVKRILDIELTPDEAKFEKRLNKRQRGR